MEVKKSFFTTVTHPFELHRVEEVVCNLCGGERHVELGTELQFSIRECRDCGLIYVFPQPAREELPAFYEGMYADIPQAEIAQRTLGFVEKHLSRIVRRRRPDGGRLLEIGSGYGNFLEAVADQPWDLTALELSESAIAHARAKVPRAEFQQGALETAEFPEGGQDAIVLMAVLEHVKDPAAAIARLTRWLAPGGLLLILVPYIGAYIRLKRWLPWLPVYFEAPRHLFDFSPQTLPEYLRRAGYENIRVEIARPYSSPTRLGAGLIWMVKLAGLMLYYLTGGRYIYPFAGAIVVHALKREA